MKFSDNSHYPKANKFENEWRDNIITITYYDTHEKC